MKLLQMLSVSNLISLDGPLAVHSVFMGLAKFLHLISFNFKIYGDE